MPTAESITELVTLSRRFGLDEARAKCRLLSEIAAGERYGSRDLAALHDVLCFMRAYPDNAKVLGAVLNAGTRLRTWASGTRGSALGDRGFPGSHNTHGLSFGFLRRLTLVYPGQLEIDWDGFDNEMLLHHALVLLVSSAECQGLDSVDLTWRGWFDAAKPDPERTDLEFLLGLFEGSDLPLETKAHLFDSCHLPIRFSFQTAGTGSFELARPVTRIHYQRKPIDRRRFPLPPRIRKEFERPSPVSPATGRQLVDLALSALSFRNLEILSLTWANPSDVWLLDCGGGIEILLIGTLGELRDPLNTTYCHLVLKNGVPLGYGPASVCLGTCEMGLNLFPQYRGAEVHAIYGQLMRCLYQILGARYFFLTSYAMGDGNPEAIESGAFWFYRKMGFLLSVPEVEELARGEEAKMRADPSYRSSTRTLRRLSPTGAYLDLSGGTCRPVDQGRLGTRLTQFIERRFGSDRRAAETRCSREVARRLGVTDLRTWTALERHALRRLAPTFVMLGGLADWTAEEKRDAVRFIRAKGGRSEAATDQLLLRHEPLREGLLALAES